MSNPLMQAMGMMQPNGNMTALVNIMRMLRSGNPEQIAMNLMQRNPRFRSFVEMNRGKSPEQVARENGVDLGQLMQSLK